MGYPSMRDDRSENIAHDVVPRMGTLVVAVRANDMDDGDEDLLPIKSVASGHGGQCSAVSVTSAWPDGDATRKGAMSIGSSNFGQYCLLM